MDVRYYVAAKIKYYRKLRGLTQKDLGNKIGIKDNTISGYEHQITEPSQDLLFKIANALDISINDLFPPTIKSKINNLTNDEQDLLKNYRMLNTNGKTIVGTTATALTNNPQYTKQEQELEA